MIDAARYGDHCAEFYDEMYPPPSRLSLDRLVELARGGPVLDAGCGTGRYAIALASRGLAVHGIDASAAMIARLRAKSGGDAIGVTLGDFACVSAPDRYRLVICMVDTLALLPDRDAQARAVGRLAASVAGDGSLLVETTASGNRDTFVQMDHVVETRGGPRRYSPRLCEVSLDDLDAWTASAGLAPYVRWRDWRATPWRGEAGGVISIFRRPQV
jgi:SAM-dependent methyltransferase